MPFPAFFAGHFQWINTKEKTVVGSLFYPSLMLSARHSVCGNSDAIKGKLCYNTSISTSLCLCVCRIARELNLSPVVVLHKGVFSLFILLKRNNVKLTLWEQHSTGAWWGWHSVHDPSTSQPLGVTRRGACVTPARTAAKQTQVNPDVTHNLTNETKREWSFSLDETDSFNS